MRIPSGVTDQLIYFVAVDSIDLVTRETGLSSFTVYRSRNGGAAAAFTTPTVTEVDATNMPGVYKLLLDEDMTIDAGDDSQEVCLHITHAGMAPVTRVYELYRAKLTAGHTLSVESDGDLTKVNTLDGHTAQTGDAFARIGANGAGLTALPWNASWDAEVQSEAADALAAYDPPTNAEMEARTLVAANYATATALATVDAVVDTILVDTDELQTDWANGGRLDLLIDGVKGKTDNLPASPAAVGSAMTLTSGERTAIANEVETQIIDDTDSEKVLTAITDKIASVNPDLGDLTLGAIASAVRTELTPELDRIDVDLSSLATAASLATVDGVVDAILLDTAEIGAAGAGLTAVPWNASWDAEVQSEVADALGVYDPPTKAELDAAIAPLATAAALATVDGIVDNIVGVTEKLEDTLEDAGGGNWVFTEAALANAPAGEGGGGGGPTAEEIADEVETRTIAAVALVNGLAANVVNAASLAADAGAEIGTAVWSTATRRLSDGTNIVLAKGVGLTGLNDIAAGAAMTLTSGERTAIANEVETQIIDDTDSEKVLTAITDKIASVNPDLGDLTLGAIASAVRTELEPELELIDAAISTRSTLSAAEVNAEVDTALADYDGPTNAEMVARTLPTANYATAASLATVDGVVDAILLDTAEIGAAGAGLTAVPYNATWSAQIQAAALAAIQNYDPPTNAELEARTLVAAGYATASSLAVVAGHVDTEVAGIKLVTDRIGGMLEADEALFRFTQAALSQGPGGGADDPLGSDVPGAYASGTAGFALGRLATGGRVQVVSQAVTEGNLTLVLGDDYAAEDGFAIDWTDDAGAWPELEDATIAVTIRGVVFPGSVVTPTGPTKQVRLELTNEQSVTIPPGAGSYKVVATLENGNVRTLVQGRFAGKRGE